MLKTHFHVVPPSPFVHSGLKNTSIFGRKLPIQTAHHTFLESRHPDVTNNLYYVFYSSQSQIPIFLGSSSWTIHFIPKTRHSLCTALFWLRPPTASSQAKWKQKANQLPSIQKLFFLVNIKGISIKKVNLSIKGYRHILKGQLKNEKLLKKTTLKQYWGTLLKSNLKNLQNIELNLLPLFEHQ